LSSTVAGKHPMEPAVGTVCVFMSTWVEMTADIRGESRSAVIARDKQ